MHLASCSTSPIVVRKKSGITANRLGNIPPTNKKRHTQRPHTRRKTTIRRHTNVQNHHYYNNGTAYQTCKPQYQINDRLSFMRFLGLEMGDKVPDGNTIWDFKEALKENQVDKKL